uniref:DBF4-type domain-containing protein n=1 Tax=Caenorhabditis tropicalis TaxID=1561998 RepID=A0A1I7UQP0_9PELO
MASDMRHLSTARGRPSEIPSGSHSKCLLGKYFLLEIENRQTLKTISDRIQTAGGHIMASFEDQNPACVVSDHPLAIKIERSKQGDAILTNEKMLKVMPALLRQAINRKIKVRTPQTFLNQMSSYVNRKEKATSATTSNSTIRGKPSLGRESSAKLERNTYKCVPRTSRVNSDQSTSREADEKSFIRIDVPGRRPDIRVVSKSTFGKIYCGSDAGFSVFKQADSSLVDKRRQDYELFCKGKLEQHKKAFKLDEKDNYCQFCMKTIVGERKDHDRTDEHRNKVRTQGLMPNLERIIMNARLRLRSQENRLKRSRQVSIDNELIAHKSKRARVEFEYGENEMKANWMMLKENTVEKTKEKVSVLSPRHRQERIQPVLGQEDYDFP